MELIMQLARYLIENASIPELVATTMGELRNSDHDFAVSKVGWQQGKAVIAQCLVSLPSMPDTATTVHVLVEDGSEELLDNLMNIIQNQQLEFFPAKPVAEHPLGVDIQFEASLGSGSLMVGTTDEGSLLLVACRRDLAP